MDLNNAFIYHPFAVERDFAALVSLLHTVELIDQSGEDVSEATLREQLTWTGHNPALDRWVAYLPDSTTLVGYGAIFNASHDDTTDLSIAVHPEWRQRNIGRELLSRLLIRARQVGAKNVCAYANVRHSGANTFLRMHAFEPIATYVRMVHMVHMVHMAASGLLEFPLPDIPAGFAIRSYDQIQQRDLFMEAVNRGYAGVWGHHQISDEGLMTWLPQLPPEGIFLLFAPDSSIAGICRAEISTHLTTLRGIVTGLIDAPGVVSTYRNANLYLPLLLTTLHWLISQSPASIELEAWGEVPDVLAQYRALGFIPIQEEISYQHLL
jgi:mycothiol synthase